MLGARIHKGCEVRPIEKLFARIERLRKLAIDAQEGEAVQTVRAERARFEARRLRVELEAQASEWKAKERKWRMARNANLAATGAIGIAGLVLCVASLVALDLGVDGWSELASFSGGAISAFVLFVVVYARIDRQGGG